MVVSEVVVVLVILLVGAIDAAVGKALHVLFGSSPSMAEMRVLPPLAPRLLSTSVSFRRFLIASGCTGRLSFFKITHGAPALVFATVNPNSMQTSSATCTLSKPNNPTKSCNGKYNPCFGPLLTRCIVCNAV